MKIEKSLKRFLESKKLVIIVYDQIKSDKWFRSNFISNVKNKKKDHWIRHNEREKQKKSLNENQGAKKISLYAPTWLRSCMWLFYFLEAPQKKVESTLLI